QGRGNGMHCACAFYTHPHHRGRDGTSVQGRRETLQARPYWARYLSTSSTVIPGQGLRDQPLSAASTASPMSFVFAVPPRSGVRGVPALSTSATALRIAAAPLGSPRWSSIKPAERIAARGLAMPLPAMSGALP